MLESWERGKDQVFELRRVLELQREVVRFVEGKRGLSSLNRPGYVTEKRELEIFWFLFRMYFCCKLRYYRLPVW